MSAIIERTVSFFIENFPSWRSILIGGPLGVAWAYSWLYLAGHLKRYRRVRTGYTRKLFHLAIFSTAALVQWLWGTPAVCLFGGMTTLVIFYAVIRGDGHPLYEAIAREKDEPHRTHYIVAAYIATLVGGLASNILFGPVAIVGYLVTGLGDAVGEPVGVRFGQHVYRVPSLTRVRAIRTWEGSAGVLVVSALAIVCSIALSPALQFRASSLVSIPVLAVVCAGVEAVSPHGWDNVTMQVIPTYLATVML
jgi:phytol kinase